MSPWLLLIVFHATCAVICFVTGFTMLSPAKVRRYPVLIKLFIISLVGMILFMVSATISHWDELSITERVFFTALPILGVYMLYRGNIAIKKLRQDKYIEYVDDIGFTLISLSNGFIIVALIDLKASPFIVIVSAIAVTYFGSKYIKSVKRKLTHGQRV